MTESHKPQNRHSSAYKTARAAFLARHVQHNGLYVCWNCGRWTADPEIDHIERTGMGGSPTRLLNQANWQILCRQCHAEKDQ